MNLIKRIFLAFTCLFLTTGTMSWAGSAECQQYTDCDAGAACELVLQVEQHVSGLTPDYDGAVVAAIMDRPGCTNYPQRFKSNINATLNTGTQTLQMVINWQNVASRLASGSSIGNETIGTNDATDTQLVDVIVNVLGPDTEAQRIFFTELAKSYIAANKRDETSRLNDAFVLQFLANGDNLERHQTALLGTTGTAQNEELGIDINWDDILIEVSMVFDTAYQTRTLLVCENDRSYQIAIETVGWIITAVAAVFTIYAGGAGGYAAAAGRAAVGVGLRAAAKAAAKVGGKAAAKSLGKAGSKQLAKSAVKLNLKKNMRGWVNYKGKGVLKTGTKNFVKQAKANLTSKVGKLLAASTGLYWIGSSTGWAGAAYALVESDATSEFVNCRDVDHNEGCYTVCGDGAGDDDLNNKVLKPIMGRAYCVDEKNYTLHEINGTSGGALLQIKSDKWPKIQSKLKEIADTGNCDYNEDDIDAYWAILLHDPDTLQISHDSGVIVDGVTRLDD